MKNNLNIIYLSFFLIGCSDTPKVEMKLAEFVDKISVSDGATRIDYKFEDKDILRLELDFSFPNDLAPEFKVNSNEHRAQVYESIVEWAFLRVDNEMISSYTGYWPKKSGKKHAKSLTLFYVVPKERVRDELIFKYIGVVLGDSNYLFEYTILQ
jgi:hypothetical protein